MISKLPFNNFKNTKHLVLTMVLVLFITQTIAQGYSQCNAFTTNEGLASNHVYDMVEDNKGFLWITTDNGVSRFDGKYFQNFSVKNGLPSNDVLQVIKDGDGFIWVNCYKQLPAYFDEVNNKFITIKGNKDLDIISKSLLIFNTLKNKTAIFYNKNGSVECRSGKVIHSNIIKNIFSGPCFFEVDSTRYFIHNIYELDSKKNEHNSFFIASNNKIVDSFKININVAKDRVVMDDNQYYSFGNRIFRISYLGLHPLSHKIDSAIVPVKISTFRFSEKYLIVSDTLGSVSVYEKKSLSLINKINTKLTINCAYIDSHRNLWIGTLDKGLKYYSVSGIGHLNIPQNLVNNNFLSIALNKKGEIAAGNYYGEVLLTNQEKYKKHIIGGNNNTAWVRKTICMGKKIVAITDNGYSIDFKENVSVFDKRKISTSLKTGTAINDSIVLLGTTYGLIKLNINTGKTTIFNSDLDRALCITKAFGNIVYYIGAKGLYKYDYDKDSSYNISLNTNGQTDNFSALAFAPDSTLWVSTTSGDLLVLQNDKQIANIHSNATMPENITCMLAQGKRIWIGSKTGIGIVEYIIDKTGFNFSNWNISKPDGLPSNTINELAAYNDTIYAATENGIAIIPANYPLNEFEILPQLIAIKINQVDFPIANNYILNSHQNNIALEFSGIELAGHFKNLFYSIDNDKNINDLNSNLLNIQLNNGKHVIYVGAVDINGYISSHLLKIKFDIEIPFYFKSWFWVLMAIILTAIVFWLINRRKLAIQKTAFQQQLALEKQRNKMTADLHDDIGASLSSLQLNSAVASQLLHRDAERAQSMLEKIEDQSKNLADKIGDIIWSMKPGKDEFMTLGSRIKNFANDIMGATNIQYQIHIDKEVDTAVKDITARKNIVFITKEAINNAVKYSRATTVSINLTMEKNMVVLVINDNGIGFDVTKTIGNGVANMKKRTEELNGIFHIFSSANSGTSIKCEIPL